MKTSLKSNYTTSDKRLTTFRLSRRDDENIAFIRRKTSLSSATAIIGMCLQSYADHLLGEERVYDKNAVDSNLKLLIDDHGGVVVVDDLADYYEVTAAWIRDWAKSRNVPRAGTAFVFDLKWATKLGYDIDDVFNNDRGNELRPQILGELIDKTIRRKSYQSRGKRMDK